MNIYIDGNFERRVRGWGIGFPDYIAAPPSEDGRFGGFLPQTEWYEGDICEVVQYMGNFMSQDRVARQYDNIFGFQPYYAEGAKTTFVSGEADVESNTKRMLVINMDALSNRIPQSTGLRRNALTIDGVNFGFTGVRQGGDLFQASTIGAVQLFNVRATFPIQTHDAGHFLGEFPAYNDKTGEYRLLDLDIDVNLDDFDILHIINYPSESNDMQYYEEWYGNSVPYGEPSAAQQIEKIINDVKKFAINGGGVYVTDPMVANALGIIGDVSAVPTLSEEDTTGFNNGHSYAGKGVDLRSAVINPWGGGEAEIFGEANDPETNIVTRSGPGDPNDPLTQYAAHFYPDLHANFMQRVVTQIDGLTDLPGDILVDALAWSSYKGTDGYHYAEKWENRPNGLNLDDELWIMGTPLAGRGATWVAYDVQISDDRAVAYPATRISDIKAGVPVTAFASKIWMQNTQVDNPYKDYAVSIAVRPGDVLGGQVMKGRIFVSFTEGFSDRALDMMHSTWDIIPPNSQIDREEWLETAYSRTWSYSSWRGGWAALPTSAPVGGTATVGRDGTVSITPKQSSGYTMLNYTNRWPSEQRDAPQMAYRGFNWLMAGANSDDNANIGVGTAKVSTKTNDSFLVEAQRSEDITVGTARVIIEAHSDADTVDSDVTVLVSTPSITTQTIPSVEAVDVDTAIVTTRSYNDADGATLAKNWVVLRLPSHSTYLTLEEN